jgi:hypothetical protein
VKQLRFSILHLAHPYAIVWRLYLVSDGSIPLHSGGGINCIQHARAAPGGLLLFLAVQQVVAPFAELMFGRVSMPSGQFTFHQEIRDAVAARDRLLLIVGPGVLTSEYVKQERRSAYFKVGKLVAVPSSSTNATSSGGDFETTNIPVFARIPDRPYRCGQIRRQPRFSHPGRTCSVASACSGYASLTNTGN